MYLVQLTILIICCSKPPRCTAVANILASLSHLIGWGDHCIPLACPYEICFSVIPSIPGISRPQMALTTCSDTVKGIYLKFPVLNCPCLIPSHAIIASCLFLLCPCNVQVEILCSSSQLCPSRALPKFELLMLLVFPSMNLQCLMRPSVRLETLSSQTRFYHEKEDK